MADVEELSAAAQRVARFAVRVAAAVRPTAGPEGFLRTWLAQAALVRRWPAVRQLVRRASAAADADLAARARRAAERCRSYKPGMLGRAAGLFQRSAEMPHGVLDEAAGLLEQAADRLAPVKAGADLVTGLDAVIDESRRAESAPGRVAALQATLDAGAATLGGLLDRLASDGEARGQAEAFGGRLGQTPDAAKAAAGLVRLFTAALAEQTGEAALWDAFGRWAADWLRAFDLDGQVVLGPSPRAGEKTRDECVIEEAFALRSVPGKSAIFRLRVRSMGRETAAPAPKPPAPTPAAPAPAAPAAAPQPPGPPGLAELEAAAERLPPTSPLRERTARLREALRGDYLREAAIELYVDYWGDAGAALRSAEPALAAEFIDRLTRFLNAAYRLSVFKPTSIHDHPEGWLAVMPGGRAVTGLVRRVHRPGLEDEHGNLRIPALVEVE